MRRLLFLTILITTASTASWAKEPLVTETPTSDPALESRLNSERFYRTKRGESLRFVARLLYGHETWWPKLVALNPGMKGMNADWRMPTGTRVKYKGAEVGTEYVVQPGDWLVRIATWKYGDIEHWEKILRENAAAISNPNLIHPGDRLVFRADGSLENTTTRQTVMNGLPTEATREPVTVGNLARTPATDKPEIEEFFGIPAYFWWGIAAGLLLLAFSLPRKRLLPVSGGREPPRSERLEFESEPNFEPNTQEGYMATFKRRPIEEYKVDETLVPYEKGDLARPSGYHQIIPKKLKKYLKVRKKF